MKSYFKYRQIAETITDRYIGYYLYTKGVYCDYESSLYITRSFKYMPIEIFNEFIRTYHVDFSHMSSYIDIRIIKDNPDLKWSWKTISARSGITIEFLLKYPNKPWCWKSLTRNSSIRISDIIEHKNLSWDWSAITRRSDVSPEDLKQLPEVCWDWYAFTSCSKCKLSYILENPNENWNWRLLSERVGENVLKNNFDKPWDWNELSRNPSISFGFKRKYKDKPWNWNNIKCNSKDVTAKDVLNNPWISWDWDTAHKSKNMTISTIRKYSHMQWNWGKMSQYFSAKTIIKNADLPWIWFYVSGNSSLTWDSIKDNPNIPWVWSEIIKNENVDLRDLSAIPNLNRYWSDIASGSNLTTDMLNEHRNKLADYEHTISENSYLDPKTITDIPTFHWVHSKLAKNTFSNFRRKMTSNITRVFNKNDVIKEELVQQVMKPSRISFSLKNLKLLFPVSSNNSTNSNDSTENYK